jgi:hypothetical protein
MNCELAWYGGDTIDSLVENITAIAAGTDMRLVNYHITFETGEK